MTLVAFRARNHPQQATSDRVDDRAVLPGFFGPINSQHRFTIDVAASAENALLPRFWTIEDDALQQSWRGERVWCNPPYSRLEPWVEKAWTEMVDNGCALVVMLLPANRCEQGFWQRHVEPYRDGAPLHGVVLQTQFLAGRMRFKMPANYVWGPSRNKGDRPPFGCVLLTWAGVSLASSIAGHGMRPISTLSVPDREGLSETPRPHDPFCDCSSVFLCSSIPESRCSCGHRSDQHFSAPLQLACMFGTCRCAKYDGPAIEPRAASHRSTP